MVKQVIKDIKTNINIAFIIITLFVTIITIYVILCSMQLYEQAEKFLQDITDRFNEL